MNTTKRLEIQRSQEKCHQRMLNDSGKNSNQLKLVITSLSPPSMIPQQQITQTEVMKRHHLEYGRMHADVLSATRLDANAEKYLDTAQLNAILVYLVLINNERSSTLTVSFEFRVDFALEV